MKHTSVGSWLLVLALIACTDPEAAVPAPPPDAGDAGDAGEGTTDTSPPPPDLTGIVQVDPPPPAISGGTLLLTRDGAFAVAVDSELDQVFVVDLRARVMTATIDLDPGDEPGRLAEDDAGRVHVALRRGGAIVSLDPRAGTLLARRSVCAAPRGIAYRRTGDELVVACAEGKLVFLPAGGGAPTRSAEPATDLRDVVVLESGELLVSRFRSAEVLVLAADEAASVLRTIRLPASIHPLMTSRRPRPGDSGTFGMPAVAWRMVPAEGGALVLHQRATSGVLGVGVPGGYGGRGCEAPGAVQTAATFVQADGVTSNVGTLENVVLGVDIAVSPSGERIVVGAPALANSRGFRGAGEDILSFSSGRADAASAVDPPSIFDPPTETPEQPPELEPGFVAETCVRPVGALSVPGHGATVAVGYQADGSIVALTHAPAQLVLDGPAAVIALSDDDRFDTGHSLFHAATEGGMACASCHPEGGDDGRVWYFSDVGERRTQSFAGALLGTEPFHWAGDMRDFTMLAHTVFEGRMGGSRLTGSEVAGFAQWLDSLEPPPRAREVDPASFSRGRTLFASVETGCALCHQGPQLTSSQTVDVGTGVAVQVPSLIGVAYRAPYMHDGCAEDLRARFVDVACGGGEMHGHTAHLTDGQIDDLVAFMSTL